LNAQLEFLAQNCVKEYEAANGEIVIDEEVLYSKQKQLICKSSKD
jgi:hypothetical protein